MVRACRDAWGSARPYATLANWRDKYGWRCSTQPGYVDPYPSQGATAGGNAQSAGNTSCSSAPGRLHAGDTAWVSDADPYPLLVFDQPGRGTNQIFTVPIRESVAVTSDPVCKDNATWVQVNYGGSVGWAAEATHLGNYNLIPGVYGGGQQQILSSAWIVLANGSRFELKYDRSLCLIYNGADLTIEEIGRIEGQMQGKSRGNKLSILASYLTPYIGEADDIRGQVEAVLPCQNPLYAVGTAMMDTSGIGNIAYGYFMDELHMPMFIQDLIANSDQMIRSAFEGKGITITDEPDDQAQRRVGKALRKRGLSINNLVTLAQTMGLN